MRENSKQESKCLELLQSPDANRGFTTADASVEATSLRKALVFNSSVANKDCTAHFFKGRRVYLQIKCLIFTVLDYFTIFLCMSLKSGQPVTKMLFAPKHFLITNEQI